MADEKPIRAQSADGLIHEFPAGTDISVIDRVMKQYAASIAPPAAAEEAPAPKPAAKAGILDDLERGLQQTRSDASMLGAAVAGRNLSAIEAAKAKADRGEYLTPLEKQQVRQYDEAKANTERQFSENVGASIDYRQKADALPISAGYKAFKDAAAEGFVPAVKAFWKAPGEVLLSMAAEGLPASAPALGAAVATGGVGGTLVAGGQSYMQAYAGKVTDLLAKRGIDINDKQAVMAALSDPKTADEIRREAAVSAIPQGVAGAAGMAIGAKTIAPTSLAARPVAQQAVNIPVQAAAQGAIAAAGEAGSAAVIGEDIQGGQVFAAAVGGASQAPLDVAAFAAHRGVDAVQSRPRAQSVEDRARTRAAAEIGSAPDVDSAIQAARETISRPEINEIATQAREFGNRADQDQAAVLQLFGGLNQGVVERDVNGGFHYTTPDGETAPLKVWDGKTGTDTVPPAVVAAQKAHYERMGVRVVYFEDAPNIPFDGAVDPRQPDTVFLSSKPSRNAAQVGAHEVAHLLESTVLPDGTNLGDLLHQQVRAGITEQGWEAARSMFAKTAPDRSLFPEGAQGDSLHADAVTTHLITELGAELGAEAPKFQTFLPRVVDALQARYGDSVAAQVVKKLLDGIQQAARTLREFFFKPEDMAEYGQPPLESRHWVTNLDEIHDTLAKMYAQRFGTQAERENAALRTMRDRAQRERGLRDLRAPATEPPPPVAPDGFVQPERPAAPPSASSAPPAPEGGSGPQRIGPPPGAAYTESVGKIATYRRWLNDLDQERRRPDNPEAIAAQQDIDAILGKVRGVEARLTKAAAERLAAARARLEEARNPTGDTDDMARVRDALAAEQVRMARAAAVGTGPSPGMLRAGQPERPEAPAKAPEPQRGRAVMASDLPPTEPAAAPVPRETARAAAPEPVAEPAPPAAPAELPSFLDTLKAERERVWEEEMGRRHRNLARNQNMAEGMARESVMRQEVGDFIHLAAEVYGLPEDEMGEIAQLYRRLQGEHPEHAFERAADLWVERQERAALEIERTALSPEDEAVLMAGFSDISNRDTVQNEPPFDTGAGRQAETQPGREVANEGQVAASNQEQAGAPGRGQVGSRGEPLGEDRAAPNAGEGRAGGQGVERPAGPAFSPRQVVESLTPEERNLSVVDILDPAYPKAKPRSRSVEDIAAELMKRGSRALRDLGVEGGRLEGPSGRTDVLLAKVIAGEVADAMQRSGRNAADWYTRKVREALAVAGALHPEIQSDPHQRFGFIAALAVTSQNETVPSNVRLAEQVYAHFKRTGRFPTDVVAGKQIAMNTNFKKLNKLLDVLGEEGTREFLNKETTRRELEAEGWDVGGENMDTRVYGSAILGPKIGQGFFQNLNGNFNPVTMDLWFMRAWGRLTGTLVGLTDISKQRERFETELKAAGQPAPKSIQALEAMADRIVSQHESDFRKYRKEYDSGERIKSDLTKSAERLQAALRGINETPTSGGQREWMRAVVNRARRLLAFDGIRLSNADLQAVWWYPEKDLYAKLGGPDSDAINVSYSEALRELAAKKGVPDVDIERAIRSLDQRPGPGEPAADDGRADRGGGAEDGRPVEGARLAADDRDAQGVSAPVEEARRTGRLEVTGGAVFSPRQTDRPLLDAPEASREELDARQRRVDKEVAEAKMRGRQVARRPQEGAGDLPLFGGPRQQDMFGEEEPAAPKPRQGSLFSPRQDDRIPAPPFYSALTRAVENAKITKGTPGQWEATIRNMPGVKPEEREWVGLDDWLRKQPKSVTKEEVVAYLRANEIQVREVMRGGDVPAAAVDALERWVEDQPKDGPRGWENTGSTNIDFQALRNGDRDAIASLEAMGAPDKLMKPVYDAINGGATKYQQYTLPGGKNYRELLLTLPAKGAATPLPEGVRFKRDPDAGPDGEMAWTVYDRHGVPLMEEINGRTEAEARENATRFYQHYNDENGVPVTNGVDYRGSHWDEPNVLAHVRFDDRTGPNGERILHVAEVQSDWHQAGRKKGYAGDAESKEIARRLGELGDEYRAGERALDEGIADPAEDRRLRRRMDEIVDQMNVLHDRNREKTEGVPDAPFKTTWPELAMKRVIRYAAENGYDRVSWDTGETNADRYDLSKVVSKVTLSPDPSGQFRVEAFDKDSRKVIEHFAKDEAEVAGVVGKEVAEKLFASRNRYGAAEVVGNDLKVGGEGMRAFYDKQLPIIANKLGKKFGAKVEAGSIDSAPQYDVDLVGDAWRVQEGDKLVGPHFDSEDEALDWIKRQKESQSAPVHSLPITDAMRESVMQGQALFSPRAPQDPAFADWFNGSKATTQDGSPQVVYRGGGRGGPKTDAPQGMKFFSDSSDLASSYASRTRGGKNVQPAYLSLKNPLEVTGRSWFALEAPEDITYWSSRYRQEVTVRKGDEIEINDLARWAKANGYDSLIARDIPDAARERDAEVQQTTYVTFDDAQARSAVTGGPLFSPRLIGTAGYSDEQRQAAERVRGVEGRALEERIAEIRQDFGRKALREVFDPFVGVKDRDPKNWVGLRIANSSTGAVDMFSQYGRLTFNGRSYDIDTSVHADGFDGGPVGLIRDLGRDAMRFMDWVAANRAERLKAEDRENLYSPEDIRTLKTLNRGRLDAEYTLRDGSTTTNREAAFADALARLDAFNKNALDIAVSGGLIKRGVADALWANPYYVPFFRQAEDDNSRKFAGGGTVPGMTGQTFGKKLKGGTERLNTNLWENAFGNWAHLIDASIRNKAANETLTQGVADGIVTKVTEQDYNHRLTKAEKADVVWTMVDGEKQYWRVDDPFTLKAVAALDYVKSSTPGMEIARTAKKVLQVGVAASPWFQVRNLIRDTETVIAVSPISMNVFKNLSDGFRQMDLTNTLENVGRAVRGKDLQQAEIGLETARAIAGGATMRFAAGVDQSFHGAENYLDTPDKIRKFWRYFARNGQALSEAMANTENVNRLALYKQLREKNVPHDLAAFEARDLSDFTMTGASPIIRHVVETVPYMNAWLQGLYKVGRAAADADKNVYAAVGGRVGIQIATKLAVVMIGMTAANLALDAFYADDPDYQARTEDDRNSNFWFKVGGREFRVPMGFEVAALSRMAAIWVETLYDKNVTAGRAWKNTMQILGTQMSLNPIPQAVKPVLDLRANETRTGAPIETAGMERLRPEFRSGPETTLISKGVSEATNKMARVLFGQNARSLSPVQLDYLVQAYSGWLGTTALQIADEAVRAVSKEPVKADKDWLARWTGGMATNDRSSERANTRYTNLLYQQGDAIQEAYATLIDLGKRGRTAEAKEYLESNRDLVTKYPLYSKAIRTEGEINQQIRRITDDQNLTGEQKRVKIMQLQALKNRIAQQVVAP